MGSLSYAKDIVLRRQQEIARRAQEAQATLNQLLGAAEECSNMLQFLDTVHEAEETAATRGLELTEETLISLVQQALASQKDASPEGTDMSTLPDKDLGLD